MALAPPIAPPFVGLPAPTLEESVAELAWPDERVGVGLVETAGGPRSPVATDADSAALAAAVDPDFAVLVAHAGLGAINAVRLCAPVVPQVFIVFLNRFDGSDVHDRNLRLLQGDGFDVVVRLDDLARRMAD